MQKESIHSIIDVIKNNNFNAYYIIDSDIENFSSINEIPYEKYCTKYRKLVNNSLFLYRQPKRLAKNRKFYIYGGGIIYKIEEENNMFTAYIKDGFTLDEDIKEDDKHFSEMEWTSKNKTNGWDHFWSQYGINEINEDDMLNIMEESAIHFFKDNEEIMSHNTSRIRNTRFNKFIDNTRRDGNDYGMSDRMRPREYIADILVNLENDKIEFLGLNGKIKARALTRIERMDKGYDVLSYDEEGKEMHIGIKISSFGSGRLDRVTRKDLEMFKDPLFHLYTVYNIDAEKGKFDFNDEKGIDLLEKYEFIPLMYTARPKDLEMGGKNE